MAVEDSRGEVLWYSDLDVSNQLTSKQNPHFPSEFSEGQTDEMDCYPLTKQMNIFLLKTLIDVLSHTVHVGFCLILIKKFCYAVRYAEQ